MSSTSMRPFEPGLPADLLASSWEVLLNLLPAPNDTIAPSSDRLLETLDITPTGAGPLTVYITALEAATSDGVSPDGRLFDPVGVDPARGSLTFEVEASGPGAAPVMSAVAAPTSKVAVPEAGEGLAHPDLARALQADESVWANADGFPGVTHTDLVYVRARLGADPHAWGDGSADVNFDGRADLALDERVKNILLRVSSPLPPGRYYWRVRTSEASFMEPWSPAIPFEVEGDVKLAAGARNTSVIQWCFRGSSRSPRWNVRAAALR